VSKQIWIGEGSRALSSCPSRLQESTSVVFKGKQRNFVIAKAKARWLEAF
jgi:hypothetical protein